MMPMLRVLGLTLPVAPTFVLLGFIIGSEFGARALRRVAPSDKRALWNGWFNSATFWAGAVGLLAARLSYAILNLPLYRESPYLLFSIRPGAFIPVPGLLAGFGVLCWYLRCRDIEWQHIGDALTIGSTAVWIIFSLRDFLTGEAYGLPTTLPWGVELWQAIRHPVQLYEMGLALFVLALLWFYQTKLAPGVTFWRFMALFGLSKLLTEAFRADAITFGAGLRVVQIEAFATMLVGLFVLSFYGRFQATSSTPAEHLQEP